MINDKCLSNRRHSSDSCGKHLILPIGPEESIVGPEAFFFFVLWPKDACGMPNQLEKRQIRQS